MEREKEVEKLSCYDVRGQGLSFKERVRYFVARVLLVDTMAWTFRLNSILLRMMAIKKRLVMWEGR